MTSTPERWFLVVTIFTGLLTGFSAMPANHDHAEAGMQAARQNQLIGLNEAAINTCAPVAAPRQPAGATDASPITGPAGLADGGVMTSLQATNFENIRRATLVAGIPDKIWCMLHLFCKRAF